MDQGMDDLERFRERFAAEASRVARYKERRRYGSLSEAAMVASLLGMLAVTWLSRSAPAFVARNGGPVAFTALVVVFVAATGFWLLSYYLLYSSGLTDELVAYHELAGALEANERGDADAVLEHLRDARRHLRTASARLVSDALRGSVLTYVDTVTTAENPQIAVRDTFDAFARTVVDGVLASGDEEFEALLGGLDRPVGDARGGVRRALADLREVFLSGMFGFWGVVAVAFGTGLAAFLWVSELSGVVVLGGLLTTYGVYMRNLG